MTKIQKTVTLRKLTVSPPLAVAPMVGLTHSAFRSLVQSLGGVGLLFTEMLAAKRLPHDNPICSPLLITTDQERPLIYQLITGQPEYIEAAVDKVTHLGADGIDLNLGCPAPMQKRQGAGMMLARDRTRLRKILQTIRQQSALPLSAKIRLGETNNPQKLLDFCSFLEDQGVDWLTIHARFSGDKFCRKPNWQAIGEIKEQVNIPVFANGGIFTVEDARKCLNQSNADGLMIGRGAVERPWLLKDIAEEIYGVPIQDNGIDKESIYFEFVRILEDRFPAERQLGRLKQFTRYYASSYRFGHYLSSGVQASESVNSAKKKARTFFASNKE